MPLYEHVFIARQDISAAQVESLVSDFTNIVSEQGGNVRGHEYWGLKTMAYRIKKNRKGHYVMMNIDAAPAAIEELERNQRLNDDVLRHLTLRVEAFDEGPSVMMQGKRDGERRGGRGERGDRRDDRERGGRERGARGDDGGKAGTADDSVSDGAPDDDKTASAGKGASKAASDETTSAAAGTTDTTDKTDKTDEEKT